MWRPRRFRTELLLVFLGLFLAVQTAGFLLTRTATERNARDQVAESLSIAGSTLQRLIDDRDQNLLQAGRLLAGDYAFKSTVASGDPRTILSMLDNHRLRIDADAMMLISLEETIIADTLHPPDFGRPFTHPWLIDRALEHERGEGAGVVFIDGRPYQFIVLPMLAPLHEAWIAIGFELDSDFIAPLKGLSRAEVSLVAGGDQRRVYASTHDGPLRAALERTLPSMMPTGIFEAELRDRAYLSLALRLSAEGEPVYALVQRRLDEALAPYHRLQTSLAVLFFLGLLAAGAGAALLARGVSRPLVGLTRGARSIAAGDYAQRVELDRRDELGELGGAFNDMARGLAERDRVRNLLGLVVSPQVADELLRRDIQLGGEEREITVLFADCRGYTTMSENLPPAEVLRRLNETLTVLTDVIERNGGIVDKYIGDAVMAVFGAPIARPDHAVRAVHCALDMVGAMAGISSGLRVGIGVNSGRVVAGNMGSKRRLNYTVIGDTVNLAARVEPLTRQYEVDVLVTEYTRAACGDEFNFVEVDRVAVKGRARQVGLFQPRRGPQRKRRS